MQLYVLLRYRIFIQKKPMAKHYQLTTIIEKEGDAYVALCPELDMASQGETIEQARENLKEALQLFLEEASSVEIQKPLSGGPGHKKSKAGKMPCFKG